MEIGRALAELFGRLLLAHMFLISGINKIGSYATTQGFMEHAGIPGELLPLVILTEIGGSLLLIVGWQTRWAALALAGFTALTAFFFISDLSDRIQMINWMMHWTIVGGMMAVFANGPGPFSLDRQLARRRAQRTAS